MKVTAYNGVQSLQVDDVVLKFLDLQFNDRAFHVTVVLALFI